MLTKNFESKRIEGDSVSHQGWLWIWKTVKSYSDFFEEVDNWSDKGKFQIYILSQLTKINQCLPKQLLH